VLLELAENHSVQGLLAKRLEEVRFARVPVAAREELQSKIRARHLFTLGMAAELFRILQAFSSSQLHTVLVKGPVISLVAYGDPAARNYVDLDLLLRQRDIRSATECMLQLGFQADLPQSAILAGKIPGEYVFRRPGTQHIVEFHTECTFRYYPKHMPIEHLFARSHKVLIDGREVPALSPEDELIFSCIHGAKDFWERLMWVADVAAIVSSHPEIDWAKTKQVAAEVGAERMLRVGIQLAAMVLGTTIPTALAGEIRSDRTSELLCRHIQTWLPFAGAAPPPLASRALFRLRMAGGGLAGVAYLLRLSLSPTEEDWIEGEEHRRSWFWDALHRPFRLFRKYNSSNQ
jgi:hypothetical protein